jgi:hypothetical protein
MSALGQRLCEEHRDLVHDRMFCALRVTHRHRRWCRKSRRPVSFDEGSHAASANRHHGQLIPPTPSSYAKDRIGMRLYNARYSA